MERDVSLSFPIKSEYPDWIFLALAIPGSYVLITIVVVVCNVIRQVMYCRVGPGLSRTKKSVFRVYNYTRFAKISLIVCSLLTKNGKFSLNLVRESIVLFWHLLRPWD